MKTVNAQTITETIAHLCIDANRNLPKDVAAALHQAEETEPFAPAKDLLSLLTKNEQIARTTQMPICQDTGMAVVFADVGQDVHIAGDFAEAVNEGVRRGYVAKIGASSSLLIATMMSDSSIPATCWIAPEIPIAKYTCGRTVLPV